MKITFEDVTRNQLMTAVCALNNRITKTIHIIWSDSSENNYADIWVTDGETVETPGWPVGVVNKQFGAFTSYRLELGTGREKAIVAQFALALAAEG